MKRVAGYFRVSTNREEQKQSLENQRNLFLNAIKDKEYELYDFYVDSKSGTNGNRENFIRLLDDAEKGLFDVIIVKELSRLARNAELANKVKRLMESKNIRIFSLDGQVDTDNPEKNKTFGLFAWVYEQEAETTSTRIKTSFKVKQQCGQFLGSSAPYGYTKNRKKLQPKDDYTVDIVKFIFAKYLEGWGQAKLAKYLSEQGNPSPSQVSGKSDAGKYWHSSSVKSILTNPHYMGHLVQNRETTYSAVNKKRNQVPQEEHIWVLNTHPAIIDETTFNLVKQKLDKNKNKGKGKGTRNNANLHLFTGLTYCSDCGKTMRYRKNSKGYVCSAFHAHGKIACSKHFIREEHLTALIKEDLTKWFSLDADSLDFDNKINKSISKSAKTIEKLENKINNLKRRNKMYLDKLIDEMISESDYKDYIHFNNIDIEQLQSELNAHTAENNKRKPDINTIRSELVKIANLEVFDRELLNMLIDRIEIKETGELKVFYTFASPVQEYNYKRLKSS